MEKQNIYQDISARTGGEIYLGVVGPVRSGKSTFIKRFMELLVLPEIKDENERKRTMDELPQSGTGKMVMTTEPKFIPKEAAELPMEDMKIKIRLIDCVGFMIPGAGGNLENGQERLVKTPWFDYEVPFTKAAEFGTRKVIRDHSTIGILVTADGSFGEIPRDSYVEAEKKTVAELNAELVSAKKELFNLRFQNATNQLDNTSRIKEVRKNIARIQTVITEKANAAE